jgi:hypothetical protein
MMFSVPNIRLLAQLFGDKDVAKLVNTDMLVKFFFLGVVLDRMLLTGKLVYVTKTSLKAVHDLEKNKWH